MPDAVEIMEALTARSVPFTDADMSATFVSGALALLETVDSFDEARILVGMRNKERRGQHITYRQARMVLNIFWKRSQR